MYLPHPLAFVARPPQPCNLTRHSPICIHSPPDTRTIPPNPPLSSIPHTRPTLSVSSRLFSLRFSSSRLCISPPSCRTRICLVLCTHIHTRCLDAIRRGSHIPGSPRAQHCHHRLVRPRPSSRIYPALILELGTCHLCSRTHLYTTTASPLATTPDGGLTPDGWMYGPSDVKLIL